MRETLYADSARPPPPPESSLPTWLQASRASETDFASCTNRASTSAGPSVRSLWGDELFSCFELSSGLSKAFSRSVFFAFDGNLSLQIKAQLPRTARPQGFGRISFVHLHAVSHDTHIVMDVLGWSLTISHRCIHASL